MSLRDLRSHVDDHLRDLRRLQYIVDSSDFEELYQKCPEMVIENVKLAGTSSDPRVRSLALQKLKAAYKKELQVDVTLRDLRSAAKNLGIVGYTKKDKMTLAGVVEAYGNHLGPNNRGTENSSQVRPESNGNDLPSKSS